MVEEEIADEVDISIDEDGVMDFSVDDDSVRLAPPSAEPRGPSGRLRAVQRRPRLFSPVLNRTELF